MPYSFLDASQASRAADDRSSPQLQEGPAVPATTTSTAALCICLPEGTSPRLLSPESQPKCDTDDIVSPAIIAPHKDSHNKLCPASNHSTDRTEIGSKEGPICALPTAGCPYEGDSSPMPSCQARETTPPRVAVTTMQQCSHTARRTSSDQGNETPPLAAQFAPGQPNPKHDNPSEQKNAEWLRRPAAKRPCHHDCRRSSPDSRRSLGSPQGTPSQQGISAGESLISANSKDVYSSPVSMAKSQDRLILASTSDRHVLEPGDRAAEMRQYSDRQDKTKAASHRETGDAINAVAADVVRCWLLAVKRRPCSFTCSCQAATTKHKLRLLVIDAYLAVYVPLGPCKWQKWCACEVKTYLCGR